MSRPLTHLTLTTSTSSLSPISFTSPFFPTVSLLHTSPVISDPYIPCDVPRQSGISTHIPSLPGYEPQSGWEKSLRQPRRSELDRKLGTDPYQRQGRFWTNLEKLVQTRLTSSYRCIPIMTQRRALQTRILKMENYEKCWLHTGKCKVEKTVNPLECQSHPRNLLHCYRWEEQVQSLLKLI